MYSDQCAALIAAFTERLRADLTDHRVDAGPVIAAIDGERHRLASTDIAPPDAPAHDNHAYAAAVLAAHKVLSAADPDWNLPSGEGLVGWLTDAFVEPFAEPVRTGTRAMLDAATDPFATMVAYARAREDVDFGTEFEFRHPVDGDGEFHADVHRCGYHDFLTRHDAAELTPVLCAFDANWIGAIEPHRDGFAFDRETTIGLGGDFCPFHFKRTD